jgi:3-hydroxyisobutyrate dehydrogenase-like beta-hydroxyacid dehydrogenase
VGFVGLGQMGKWMALNILKKGHSLWVYDIRAEVVSELAEQGAQPARDLTDLGDKCERIILCLPDSKVVERVLFGEKGIETTLRSGMIIIDCSTTDTFFARSTAEKLNRQDIVFLDAPVSGMAEKVREGRLTIMVGGQEAAFKAVQPLLEAMGNNIVYLGGSGNGQLAKTLNNVLFNISCAAMAEILPMAAKMGIAPEAFCSIVMKSSGQSYGFDFFAPLVLKRNFEPGYPLAKAYKDMANLMKISAQYQIPLPVTSATMHTYQMALALGHGTDNKGAMIKVWEKMLGVLVEEEHKRAEND